MPNKCKLKILIGNRTQVLKDIDPEKESVSFDDIAEIIAKSNKETRLNIMNFVKSAKSITLNNRLIKNYLFVSNTTLTALLSKFPALKEEFKDLDVSISDNYTIVAASKIMINGSESFGRTVDPQGKEIFFVKSSNYYAARKLFQHIQARAKIKEVLNDNGTLKESNPEIEAIAKEYRVSVGELLNDFLVNRSKIKVIEVNGKRVNSQVVLNKFLFNITNDTSFDITQSPLEYSLSQININKDSANPFDMKFNVEDLYTVLKQYNNIIVRSPKLDEKGEILYSESGEIIYGEPREIKSANDFLNLSENEISYVLLHFFANEPHKLMKFSIKSISNAKTSEEKIDSKERNISLDTLLKIWENIVKSQKDIAFEENFNKAVKANPELVKEQIENYIKTNGFEYDGEVYNDFESSTIEETTITETKKKKKKVEKDGKVEEIEEIEKVQKPKKVIKIKFKTKEKTKTISGSKTITINFPFSTLQQIYDPCYDTKLMFVPVNNEIIKDGYYNGFYVYERYNGSTPHYYVSRHYISENARANLFNDLDGAMLYINRQNETTQIYDESFYELKRKLDSSTDANPRVSEIQGKFSEGQLITILNYPLNNGVRIGDLSPTFSQALHDTLPNFYKRFNMIENIEKLDTPEKAMIFIMEGYKMIARTEKGNNGRYVQVEIEKAINDNIEKLKELVDKIDGTSKISFIVEKKMGKMATLKPTKHNGTDILVTGEYEDNPDPNYVTTQAMNDTCDYFRDKYGLKINSFSYSEMKLFVKDKKLGFLNKLNSVKAFVFDGEIYINNSIANLSDLFHEVSHIFLGILKVQDPEKYNAIIEAYSNGDNSKRFAMKYDWISKTYGDFAEADKVEECVADIIADTLFNKLRLTEDKIDGDYLTSELQVLYKEFISILSSNNNTNPIDNFNFEEGVKSLISENLTGILKRMKISNYIKDAIKDGTIKESCE